MATLARKYMVELSKIVAPNGFFNKEPPFLDGDADGAPELVGDFVGFDVGLDFFVSSGDMTCDISMIELELNLFYDDIETWEAEGILLECSKKKNDCTNPVNNLDNAVVGPGI